jgi:hypothetical protein
VILNVEKQLAGQNQELCRPAEANGRAKAERESHPVGLWEAIEKVAKKQRHERGKVSGLQEAMGEIRRQIEGVMIKLRETDGAVERWVRTRGDEGSYVSGRIRCRSTEGSDGRGFGRSNQKSPV